MSKDDIITVELLGDSLSHLVGRVDYKCEVGVVCERAGICTQRLVVCEHQKIHSEKNLLLNGGKLLCTTTGYCSVAEINCKCVPKVR